MKRLLFIFTLTITSFNLLAQNEVTFLDGKSISIDGFMESCVQAFINQGKNNAYSNNGKDLCECFIKKLSKKYTLSEFISKSMSEISLSKDKEELALNFWQHKEVSESMAECISNNPQFLNNEKIQNHTAREMEVLVRQCKINLKNESSIEEYNEFQKIVNVNDYCECYVKNIFKEFTIKEMLIITEKTQSRMLEISELCVIENMK
tara:strand:- start:37 stop:654 length:618 start_codon:yes stop_codon:yes gene_type:complete